MKHNWIPLLSTIIAMLAACGQTGPLFLPEEQPVEQASGPDRTKETDKQSDTAKTGEEDRADVEEEDVELDVELKEKKP
jgi:predicted small lipoprotein YifL